MLAPENCHSRTQLTSDSRFMSSPVRVLSKKPVSCPISRLNNVQRRRHMTRSAAELNSLQGSILSQTWSGRLQSRVLRSRACPQACECHAGLLHEMPQHAGLLHVTHVGGYVWQPPSGHSSHRADANDCLGQASTAPTTFQGCRDAPSDTAQPWHTKLDACATQSAHQDRKPLATPPMASTPRISYSMLLSLCMASRLLTPPLS